MLCFQRGDGDEPPAATIASHSFSFDSLTVTGRKTNKGATGVSLLPVSCVVRSTLRTTRCVYIDIER
jgi:hypothetical protein